MLQDTLMFTIYDTCVVGRPNWVELKGLDVNVYFLVWIRMRWEINTRNTRCPRHLLPLLGNGLLYGPAVPVLCCCPFVMLKYADYGLG